MLKTYRYLISEFDYALRLEKGLGYKVMTGHTFLVLGMLSYSLGMDLGLII